MEEIIKKLEEKKKKLEILVDKLNTIIYDLKDYEDLIREEEIAPTQNLGQIIKVVGEKQKEKDRIELLNTEQKIKPVVIDLENLSKKEIKKLKKEGKKGAFLEGFTARKSKTKFPEEMEGFVKENLNLKYRELAEKVNKKFGLNMDSKNMSDYLRYRNIKKEVIYSDDLRLKNKEEKVSTTKRKYKKRIGKYPPEMKGFIERHMETNSNQALIGLINEKWDIGITMNNVKNYMKYNKLRRVNIIRTPRRTKEKIEGEKKVNKQQRYPDEMEDFIKEYMEINSSRELVILINETYDVGITLPKLAAYMSYKKIKRERKANKYTDQVIEFLKENIKNFTNREICKELEMRFDIKVKVGNLSNFLSKRGIKREFKTVVDQEIIDFIKKSKITDVYYLRDKIIEKFEKNIPTEEIRKFMNKNIPGESVKEEVKRIEGKIEEEFDESIDGMDLDG